MLALLHIPQGFEPIDQILDSLSLKGSIAGVSVSNLSGEVLYSRNAETRLMPASNQKLLSVAYALYKLGPEFVPVTRFWKREGCLFVDAPGDPSMTYDRLVEIRKQLKIRSVKKVAVRQAYRPGYGPGWEWDDLPNRYAPSITALAYDTASFELWGDANKFWLRNGDFGIKMRWQPNEKSSNTFDLSSRNLVIASAKPKTATKIEAFAQPNPDAMAAKVLGGPLLSVDTVPEGDPDLVSKGLVLTEIAKNCLQPSDNYIAESLLMMAASSESPLTKNAYSEAAKRLKTFLVDTVGLEKEEADPYDGSGLSRHNNVTPSGISKILLWAKRQSWHQAWEDALASPGVGTLKNRLKNTSFRGKTGTLNKASSLSGYVKCKDGQELVVSIIINHYLGGDAVARKAQDDIIEFLSTRYPNGQNLASAKSYGIFVSNKINRTVNAHRLARPHFDSSFASQWTGYGNESSHASLH